MDNASLTRLLSDDRVREYWLKPTGNPERPPEVHTVFNQARVRVEFRERPRSVRIGDILILYRIGVSMITCVTECLTAPVYVTQEELQTEPWRERWPWSVETRNLTPEYGSVWNEYDLQPFPLVREYNQLHPEEPQGLGALQFSKDKVKIRRRFAEFIMQRIIQLP